MGLVGKILFPIPDRRVSKRLYRQTNPTLLFWGREDRLISPRYPEQWQKLLPQSELVSIPEAGHVVTQEQPAAVAQAIAAFLSN